MIDLHCHSFYSDGALSPQALLDKAQARGLRYLALTDHDTLEGYDHVNTQASSVTLIKGIELSTRWKKYDIHILGYQLQESQALQDVIAKQKDSRIQRAMLIGERLEAVGIADAYKKACDLAGHCKVGRPHFARILVAENKVKDIKAAFKQYLGSGKVAYIPTPWISIAEAVHCINEAQGQAVIAHPLKYGLTRSKLHELIKEFKQAGGNGMEVVSGELTTTQIQEMAGTCARFDLLASTGSDFHGEELSRIGLGCQAQLPETCKPIWHDWTN